MTKTWTTEEILNLIDTRADAVYRGLVAIYERQTADEKASQTTNKNNGKGFNGRDAKFGSSLAQQIIAWNNNPNPTYRYPLSRTQLEKGRKLLRKYAGQLARVANEKAQAQEEAEVAMMIAEGNAEREAELAYERYLEDRAEVAFNHEHRGYDW